MVPARIIYALPAQTGGTTMPSLSQLEEEPMKAKDIVGLYGLLVDHGVRLWVDGGWGVDALLTQQTRPHKDFDALVHFDDLVTMADLLAAQGCTLKEIWSENRWVSHAIPIQLIGKAHGADNEVATAFVLRNGAGHELDIHVLNVDDRGYGIPAWDSTLIFPPDAFTGRGMIADTPVCCLSAQMQMTTHTGYALQDKDLHDLRLLHTHFGIPYLEEQARILAPHHSEDM
jgi:lincosamide nucleotidyltransferase A/C/D/E